MNKRSAILIILLIGIISCKGKNKIPSNVLPPDKMQLVLVDMMKADQFLSDYVLNRDTAKKREVESIKIYDQVFAIHNITAEKFFKSFTYYQQHPTFLQPIMDSLSKPVEAKSLDLLPPSVDDTVIDSAAPTIRKQNDTLRRPIREIAMPN